MQRERLTLERIKRFSCPNGKRQDFLWDSEMPRLAVRATAAGAKSFIFESKLNRKTLRLTIGDIRTWTLEAARGEARRLQTLIDQGQDPRIEKQEKLAETAAKQHAARVMAAPAMEAWQDYIEARRNKWGERHLHDHERLSQPGGDPVSRGRRPGQADTTQPGILRPLLARPLVELTPEVVQAWLAEEATTRPTQAALAFRLLRGFLNWCDTRPEYKPAVQAEATASHIARNELPKKAAKDDCLQREQLGLWFDAVRRIPNRTISSYLQILLLVGCRREELGTLEWSNVDFQWKSLTIKDKVQGQRVIPMTPYVESLLVELKARRPTQPISIATKTPLEALEPVPWVFASSRSADGRMVEPRIAHNRAMQSAGLPHLTLHGLRRSFGTLAEWVECPTGIVAQIQGHRPSATAEKHYRVRPLDLLRMWHTKIEGWMLEQAGIEQPTESTAPTLQVVKTA